jgi:hypothetical protein
VAIVLVRVCANEQKQFKLAGEWLWFGWLWQLGYVDVWNDFGFVGCAGFWRSFWW